MYLAVHFIKKFFSSSAYKQKFVCMLKRKGKWLVYLFSVSPIPALCRSSVSMGGVNGSGGYYISPDF